MTEQTGARRPRFSPEEARERILAAAGDILDTQGYAGTTIEEIATKAGVAKKSVYRWWPNKAAVVADLLAQRSTVHQVPDQGDTRAELLDLFDAIIDYTAGAGGSQLLLLLGAVGEDGTTERAIIARIIEPRRAVGRAVVQRGIARGDLPADLDVDALLDVWNGVASYRSGYRNVPLLRSTVLQLVDLALAGHAPRLA
ncbi:TetR family transcriptional regulator [Actinoplanes sp. OR16]|uniref:TetR/AcrR family transcriptional regulator n=1 Tax=Actinoplanes sp. OR16 TaxID=946334 RepID=UPI000F709425|nr:TetR/AcrR family transcriptional regulator [Actinoplanes sp. OR16]BBH70040.1 TetR family transcriptional regulator [Actinoplanes sp. OR16]